MLYILKNIYYNNYGDYMKKLITILILLLLITGCSKEANNIIEKRNVEPKKEEVIKYIDENTTPIGIYKLNGNTLTKLTTINKSLSPEEVIDSFQIFPSNEDTIYLNNSFANEFYNKWQEYNPNNNIKIGFNIKIKKTSNEEVSYNILHPNQTFDQWELLMNYLYDDYINQGKGFYSHLEADEYTDTTLFTTFKMQASYSCPEIANIKFTVFTYDTEDDFENNEYRGNSHYTLNICIDNYEC